MKKLNHHRMKTHGGGDTAGCDGVSSTVGKRLRYLSLFSGIEAATAAWEPLDWQAVAYAEIEPFCCAALQHYFPGVPNLGDVRAITKRQIRDLGHIDLVVFGSPCQDLSVAGRRAGLRGERSGLFFQAMEIVRWTKARFALWENVPGAFSSNCGNDFARVVGEMVGVRPSVPKDGWQNSGFAVGPAGFLKWCVLDAQFFGVPQRRRRVFALRDSGNWANRPPILLERESLLGNPAPRRTERKGTIRCFETGAHGCKSTDVCPCLDTGCEYGSMRNQTGIAVLHSHSDGPSHDVLAFSCKDHGQDGAQNIAPTLRSMAHREGTANGGGQIAVAFESRRTLNERGAPSDIVSPRMVVIRRLTPRECERLQGFRDDYTLIPEYNPRRIAKYGVNRGVSDGPRYRALGNSMAVPCMRWIGERIEATRRSDA